MILETIIGYLFIMVLAASFIGSIISGLFYFLDHDDEALPWLIICGCVFFLCILLVLLVILNLIQQWLCKTMPVLFQCPT